MTRKLVVVTGIGGMGVAVARRMGSGARLILAEIDEEKLARAAAALSADGYDVVPLVTDVSDPAAVARLADTAAAEGPVATLVHTAGLSPNLETPDRIFEVNLLGTALVLAAFEPLDDRLQLFLGLLEARLGQLVSSTRAPKEPLPSSTSTLVPEPTCSLERTISPSERTMA